MIKVLEYRIPKSAVGYAFKGWWVEVNGNKIYAVDEHWLFASEHVNKLLPDVDREIFDLALTQEENRDIRLRIQQNWMRVRCFSTELNIQVYEATQKYHDALIRFLQKFAEKYNRVETVFVTTYSDYGNDNPLWSRVSFNDALNSRSFRDLT